MIRIAFIKFGGCAAGGTEKYLQTLASSLPKSRFEVDYFYTDGVPLLGNSWIHPDTDTDRINYMTDNGINLIYVECEARQDSFGPPHRWVNHNFFEVFDSAKYDIVQTGRSGYAEYPFTEMHDSIFVDSIHGAGAQGIEHRDNIAKTVLLSQTHIDRWIENGGNQHKVEKVPPLIEFPSSQQYTLHTELGIKEDRFVFGMHQGNREDIFSPIPLNAYSMIANESNMFLIMGGAQQYRRQAEELGLKNVKFVDFSGDAVRINNFICTLDVFAHGRSDGEMCSAAIIEALYHGKPIVSCPGINMGHIEQIGGCGVMTYSVADYAMSMQRFQEDRLLLENTSIRCKEKYNNAYSLDTAIEKYVNIYEEVYERYGK